MHSTLPADEIPLPIPKQAERLTGKRPSPATVWRWLRKGCRGVRLNAVMLGGQWLCTESDFREFIRAQTEAQMAQTTVRRCIDQLPEAYRTVLLLRDIEEWDTNETAALLNLSRCAVKTRLHRARQALRTLLEPVLVE